WSCSKAASSAATSRPAPSPWRRAPACAARSSSVGKGRPGPRPSRRDTAADEPRLSPVPDGQDAHLPALQGGHSGKPEHLPGLHAPPALRFGGGEAPGGRNLGPQGGGHHPPSTSRGSVGVLR